MPEPPPPSAADLRARVDRLPDTPGVYLWRDADGRVLYVGKAAALRTRVRAYLGAGDGRPLVRLLMRRAADLEVVPTATPQDALLLENTLIKRERPPYNLRLKDDKSYLLVRVDRRHPFPRLRLVRRVRRDGALYVGPFASAKGVRRTLRFLRTLYPLRSCSDRELGERTRPCLYHQIGRCVAPCVLPVDPAEYATLVEGAVALLKGRDDGVRARLEAGMLAASQARHYERAALLRDRLAALDAALARQEAVVPDPRDRDVFAVAQAGGTAMVGVLYVREGHVVATRALPQRTALARAELLHALLARFYLRGKVVPAEILLEEEPADREGLEAELMRLRGGPVALRVPRRGPARRLVAQAARGALAALEEHGARARQAAAALRRLAEVLELAAPPERVEGYDLSHLGGSDPVAAMAVLVGGVPDSASYRHFAIREAAGGDDYAGMREVVRRRFVAGEALGDLPDLLLIDGGAAQVEAARHALAAAGMGALPVVGLAKARLAGGVRSPERLVRPGRAEALVLPPEDPGLRLLVRVRDEAHRFAGRYQRTRRAERQTEGALSGIAGVGPARRRRLLQRFGSVEGIRQAPFEDLAALPGIGERLARRIRERLERAP